MNDQRPTFSIIIPVYNREELVERAIISVLSQTFPHWQLIVVDDGSDDNTVEVVRKYLQADNRIKLVKQDTHRERAKSMNNGFSHADGIWHCWLDSDDAYLPIYLESMYKAIEKYPDFKIFNFGAMVVHNDHRVTIRKTFEPEMQEEGHEVFNSGKIGAGSFIYRAELIEEVGYFPEVNNCYDFAAEAKKQYSELKDLFGEKELGNPWGQDYFMFYKLTRKHHSKPLDTALYVQYVRGERQWP